jgi:hypothetical protein
MIYVFANDPSLAWSEEQDSFTRFTSGGNLCSGRECPGRYGQKGRMYLNCFPEVFSHCDLTVFDLVCDLCDHSLEV